MSIISPESLSTKDPQKFRKTEFYDFSGLQIHVQYSGLGAQAFWHPTQKWSLIDAFLNKKKEHFKIEKYHIITTFENKIQYSVAIFVGILFISRF